MNIHIDADGGLVSNPSDREIQGTSALAAHAAALVSDVSTLSWNEPRIAKRDIGHLSNMKLNDPSTSELSIPAYIGKSTGRALDFGFHVCLSVQKCYTNRRDGDRPWWIFANRFYQLSGWEQRNMFPFGSRVPEVKVSLACQPSRYRFRGKQLFRHGR